MLLTLVANLYLSSPLESKTSTVATCYVLLPLVLIGLLRVRVACPVECFFAYGGPICLDADWLVCL